MTRPAMLLLVLAGCGVTPVTNKISPGEDPFVIAVAEGPDGATDLFAAQTGGGPFYRLTFSRPAEWAPRISPAGTAVAFMRARREGDSTEAELVVYDLVSGRERRGAVPSAAGAIGRLGWNRAGDTVYLGGNGSWQTALHPVDPTPVPDSLRSRADSALDRLLGSPAFGRIDRCQGEACVVTPAGDTTRLGADVLEAIRWGPDSLALIRASGLEVRSLGGGRPRVPLWTSIPPGFRTPTYHPGEDASAR